MISYNLYALSCGKIVIVYGPYDMKSIGIFRYHYLASALSYQFAIPKIAKNQLGKLNSMTRQINS